MIVNSINYTPFCSGGINRKKDKKTKVVKQSDILKSSVNTLKSRVINREVPRKGRFVNIVQVFPTKNDNIIGFLTVMPDETDFTKRELIACVKHKRYTPITQVKLAKKKTNEEIVSKLNSINQNIDELEKTYDTLSITLEKALEKIKRPF